MNKKSELLHFYDNYYNSIVNIEKKDEFADKFYQSLLAGENEVYQKYISETKIFDETWIKTVESYVPSLNKIILNPPSATKVEEEVVAIEKARKITSESVKHLAANTHMIKEIQPDGMVRPKRILTSYVDIDYGTYENRFIMTLIDRLFIFVRSRYEVIRTNIESFERRRFHTKSNFSVNDTSVDVEVNLTLTDEIANKEINKFNKKILKRVEYLNKIVSSLKSSNFMDLMKEQRKIYPPIMKTNTIQKNVDFRNAYMLWLFLDRYNTLAFTTEIEEKDLSFTDKYFDDVNRQMLTLYSSVVANQEMNKETYENIKSKKFKKNSIKIVRSHPDDIHLTPEDEMMEDQTLNEYYLNAIKEIFKQSLEYHEEQASTYETSVKRALRETLNISNALYESFFELDEESDVFTRLIKEVDVNEELKEARRKAFISRLIREVKEVDFNNALRQERKFLDDIAKFDRVLLREYEQKLIENKQELERKERIEKDRQQALLEKEIIEKQLKENKFLSDEIDKYRIETNKIINDYQRELNKKLEKEVNVYDKELKEITKKALDEYRKIHEPKRKVTLQQLKVETDKIKEEGLKTKQTLLSSYESKLKEVKQEIKIESETKLKENKEEYMAFVKANEKNVKILESYEQQLVNEIKKYKQILNTKYSEAVNEYSKRINDEELKQIALNKEKYKVTNIITNEYLKQQLSSFELKLKQEKEKLLSFAEQRIKQEQKRLETQSEHTMSAVIEQLKRRQERYNKNKEILSDAISYINERLKEIK